MAATDLIAPPSICFTCTKPFPTTPKFYDEPSAKMLGAWGDHLTAVFAKRYRMPAWKLFLYIVAISPMLINPHLLLFGHMSINEPLMSLLTVISKPRTANPIVI
jgi:hypothetical protein